MHVRGRGAVRLYIQLAPWRYSTEHFGVEFRFSSDTDITTGFGSKSKTASFNIYYYTVGSLFEVCASPVTSRTLSVPCYLITNAQPWTKLLIFTILLGTVPKEKIGHSRVAKEQRIYCVRRWSVYIRSRYNYSTSALCASAIKLNFSSSRRRCTHSSEMDVN